MMYFLGKFEKALSENYTSRLGFFVLVFCSIRFVNILLEEKKSFWLKNFMIPINVFFNHISVFYCLQPKQLLDNEICNQKNLGLKNFALRIFLRTFQEFHINFPISECCLRHSCIAEKKEFIRNVFSTVTAKKKRFYDDSLLFVNCNKYTSM